MANRNFLTENFTIVFSEGAIDKIYIGEDIISSSSKDFYQVVEIAMNELLLNCPSKFLELYKSLYFNTREYKIAKRVYGPLG